MNLANTIFQKTSPNKEMPGDVFDSLMESVKISILNENEFEYRGKYNNYEIGFALINGNLDVDVFGKWHKNINWLELEPNNSQINEMNKKIGETIIDQGIDYNQYLPENVMWQNGHKPEDFY